MFAEAMGFFSQRKPYNRFKHQYFGRNEIKHFGSV